jgi:predicted DNA-binding transcriptional regulator AlpA
MLINKRQLREMIGGYSNTHIARLIESKRLPAPLKPFGRNGKALWDRAEVIEYINEWRNQRDS